MNDSPKSLIEYKSIEQGLQDVDKGKREMVGMFSNYLEPDMVGDLSTKGMFDRTWRENKSRVKFLYEHDTTKVVGKIGELWDDASGAYYKSIVGTHKFGDDVLDMADAGLLNEHSFGYVTVRAEKKSVKTQPPYFGKAEVKRKIIEVKHLEVSVVGGDWGVHGRTPIISVNKSLSSEEAQSLIDKMEVRYKTIEKFCRNSNASDDTIELLLLEVKQLQQNIVDLSISSTPAAEEAPEPPKGYKSEDVFLLDVSLNNYFLKHKA